MNNYILYSLVTTGKGKVSNRLAELGSYPWGLTEAKRRALLSVGRTKQFFFGGPFPVELEVGFKVLRLPDDKREREAVLSLAAESRILSQPLRFSEKCYLLLTPLSGEEEGVSYISGVFRTQGDAKDCPYQGELVALMYKGSRLSISGQAPAPYTIDIWNEENA